jgi:hypothetical protein
MTNEKIEHWFVMDARAIYDTDEASVIWSAGNKRPSKRELRDFAGEDACLCVQRGDSMEFVELI